MISARSFSSSAPFRTIAVSFAISLAAPALAAPQLRAGDLILTAADIADARAYPQVEGGVAMLVTLEPAASAKLKDGAVIDFRVDGTPLCTPGAALIGGDGTILLPCFAKRDAAEVAALAKTLSGKDPLPDSLDDEP